MGRAVCGAGIAALCLTTAMAVSGCASHTVSTCYPSAVHLNRPTAPAGTTLTISSGPFQCHASYPAGKRYGLVLALAGRAPVVRLGTTSVHHDGSFRAVIRLPRTAPPGTAFIEVTGSPYDKPCDDASAGALSSCASYATQFTLLPHD